MGWNGMSRQVSRSRKNVVVLTATYLSSRLALLDGDVTFASRSPWGSAVRSISDRKHGPCSPALKTPRDHPQERDDLMPEYIEQWRQAAAMAGEGRGGGGKACQRRRSQEPRPLAPIYPLPRVIPVPQEGEVAKLSSALGRLGGRRPLSVVTIVCDILAQPTPRWGVRLAVWLTRRSALPRRACLPVYLSASDEVPMIAVASPHSLPA